MNCIVTIKDFHNVDGSMENAELTSVGELTGTADCFTVSYTENSDWLSGTVTEITVKNGCRAEIVRKGKYATQIIAEQGKRHNFEYATPYGRIHMGIYASKVESEYNENGASLDLCYAFDREGVHISQTRIKLSAKYKEAK